ncbi:cytoplasmic axial filament protein CafA and Ribonuclease G [Bradyrhizobiaceae bacterium SG-6C]|nr:cytoplasmic axial filament protein CafA and Ribonuclease G [Bradyrhizobiaceae bacterium SG-6C]
MDAPAPAPRETEPVAQNTASPDDTEGAPRKRSTVREKVSFFFGEAPKPEPTAAPIETPVASNEPAPSEQPSEPAAPRRAGWWSRRGE